MAIALCHPGRFAHCKGFCKSCYDKHLRQINPGYKKRQQDNTSEWFKRNPEARKAAQIKRKEKERANPLIRRASFLKTKYNLSLKDYENMLLEQNGGCAICFRKPGIYPLHVDHNHNTGIVRGLLCHQCNWYLGVIEKDQMILERLRIYLEKDYARLV